MNGPIASIRFEYRGMPRFAGVVGIGREYVRTFDYDKGAYRTFRYADMANLRLA